MPVGLQKLLKEKPKESIFEELISQGLFDVAGKKAEDSGFKRFGGLLISLGDILPYVSSRIEEKIKQKVIEIYRNTINKKPAKVDTIAFSTLEGAMEFLKLKADSIVKAEEAVDLKSKLAESKRMEKERVLLQPTTKFRTISKAHRIGATRADIILICNRSKLTDALKSYNYTIDGFSRNQVIIRNVELLAIRSDSFYSLHKRGDPIIKKKPKKGSWQENLAKKRKMPQFTDRDLTLLVSRNKRLRKYKIVSKDYFRYEGHVYMLLLPPTVIMEPFCQQRGGKIIPIINSWAILGI